MGGGGLSIVITSITMHSKEFPSYMIHFVKILKLTNVNEHLFISWIPTCAKVFLDKNELWQHLVPPGADDSTELVEEFFACVAALMSIQLRSMIINSLADFLSFFAIHKVSSAWFNKFY